MNPNTGNL